MRDGVTLRQRLSLAGHKPRISPVSMISTTAYLTLIHVDGLEQDGGNSIADTLELPVLQ